jgi:hypothetical protein
MLQKVKNLKKNEIENELDQGQLDEGFNVLCFNVKVKNRIKY